MQIDQSVERVCPQQLQVFVKTLLCRAGMPEEKASFLADLLVKNDLRGVLSHGTRQAAAYARDMRDGLIHPNPHVRIVDEKPTTIRIDGDGGLGYFPCHFAANKLIEKCGQMGIAAAVTQNHGHIGAAGIYAKILVEQQRIAFVTSGHQLSLDPHKSVMRAAGGSPMSFAIPAGTKDPMILDFGTMHDLYEGSPNASLLFEKAPGLVFRSMGLGFVCQALGGFLAGVPVEEERAQRVYQGAGQGSLMIALDVNQFMDQDRFFAEMETYVNMTGLMQPMPGYDRSTLPGALEAIRERQWQKIGIPMTLDHKKVLSDAAAQFDLALSF